MFGGDMTIHHQRGVADLDGWVQFRVCGRTAVLCKELRRLFDELLLAKAKDPRLDVSSHPLTEMITGLL